MKQTLNLEPKTLKFSDFEALNEQELRKTEGGVAWGVVACVVVACVIFAAGAYAGYRSAEDAAK
ncbi:MAG: class IIb bacteriocin, lactobin A/cerein 7B family [Capnocytophaga sp.]|nr:class IIb bacteriocin, lactobin A/cerein 7B family [Capnocytophaga sp.]